MGRIFSTEALFAGHVPDKAAFASVERLLAQELACKYVASAAVFGSVATGKHTARSDLDVCVVTKKDTGWSFHHGLLADLRSRATALHVPVQFVVLDLSQAEQPGNAIGPGLRAHLASAGRRLVGTKDPLEFITGPTESLQAEALAYLGRKRNRLQQDQYAWRDLSWSERRRALERALDGPVHLARKIVHAQMNTLPMERQSVLDAFTTLADHHMEDLGRDAFRKVVHVDAEYTDRIFAHPPWKIHRSTRLEETFKSAAGYEAFLDQLWHKTAHDAWEFYFFAETFFT